MGLVKGVEEEMQVRLEKEIVIPVGTLLEYTPYTSQRLVPIVEASIPLGERQMYCSIDLSALDVLGEWFTILP